MATYNGEKFISEQLDSLRTQTYVNWQLVIRDDGSKDNTVPIIREYISRDNRITLIINETNVRGACANFSSLLSYANNNLAWEYIMFSDQDDIWKSKKIERSLAAIIALENNYKNSPALVYTNFELMDSSGGFILGEYKLKHHIRLNNLMSFNYVFGCTMIFNKQLADKISNIPFEAENHDYWIALVASIYQSHFLNEKLIHYRQHSGNASGNVVGNNTMASRIRRLIINPEREIGMSRNVLAMLKLFFERYKDELSHQDKTMLECYFLAFDSNRLAVIYRMLKDKIFKKGFFQTLSSFYQVLFFYNRIKAKRQF
ncbi:MAG: glycosyl transferase family 2 [Mucilaginibacter sp.]|nr:glycosyl transferase family 2 [Mucilaginibacter sp.]